MAGAPRELGQPDSAQRLRVLSCVSRGKNLKNSPLTGLLPPPVRSGWGLWGRRRCPGSTGYFLAPLRVTRTCPAHACPARPSPCSGTSRCPPGLPQGLGPPPSTPPVPSRPPAPGAAADPAGGSPGLGLGPRAPGPCLLRVRPARWPAGCARAVVPAAAGGQLGPWLRLSIRGTVARGSRSSGPWGRPHGCALCGPRPLSPGKLGRRLSCPSRLRGSSFWGEPGCE